MRILKKLNKIKNYLYRKANNIIFIRPIYFVQDKLDENSVVLDFGTGDDADFSLALIERYSLKSFGFDPTRKHFYKLKKLEEKTEGNFVINNVALSSKNDREIDFFESQENVSGSFFKEHRNIKNDKMLSYKVKSFDLSSMLKKYGPKGIDLIKIDVEGEEYDVINKLEKKDLDNVSQIIIEFHHHCIDGFKELDTRNCVEKIRNFGYRFYSDDGINYLFYKDGK